MTELDPRLNAYRPDLAAAKLKGKVEAERFVEGNRRQVARGAADLRRRPDDGAPLDSELLHGETVMVYEEKDGWAWVRNETDGYVGYVPLDALSDEIHAPSHRVNVLRTFVYPEPDLKSPPRDALPLTAAVTVAGEKGGFSELAGGGWVFARHLAGPDEAAPGTVATALEFLGVPYLWGGKTSQGLDCSALVQLALHRAGLACPRDSDMQAESLGEACPVDQPPRRGDLIYFPGHVAVALDDWRVVNANAHDMLVAIEPLADLVARVEAESGRGITAVRRLAEA